MLSLQPQAKACGSGEAYRPTSVDIVLGRRDVLLRDPHGKLVKRAPTSRDLWGLGPGFYIDLPGNPLHPACSYERQFRNWNDGRPPSVCAHVATDPSDPGKVAVQYWFYYTFNDFTDKHESDWEMAQVDFAASSVAAALRVGPYEVDLSQHAGGERSGWTDTKLQWRARTQSSMTPRARTPTTSAARCTSGEARARDLVAMTPATPHSGWSSRPFSCRTSRRLRRRRTHGSGSKDVGARRREASTMVQPEPTVSLVVASGFAF